MSISPENTTIGFIGTGVMGRSMAEQLLAAGYKLCVYNRSKHKTDELVSKGAQWMPDLKEMASHCQVLVSIVGFPSDVEDVYIGTHNLVAYAASGTILIDMTTSSPVLAKTIHQKAAQKAVHVLDAPVSGGDIGARNGTLSIMVGGDVSAHQKALPIFEKMGKNIVYQGPAGSGQYTKMVNQIIIASNMVGLCESLAYAKKSGLNPETVLKSISSGAAGSWGLDNLAPRILKGDYSPGFFVKHFIKDMGIAVESAEAMELNLPGLKLAKTLYEMLAAKGGEELGTQGLFRLYEKSV